MKKVILYGIVFVVRVVSFSVLGPLILMALLLYQNSDPIHIYFLIATLIDILLLIICQPVWKKMCDKTLADSPKKIKSLLESKDLPLDVRNAIHAFQTHTATLKDAITVSPYGIYILETYNLLKKQNFPFVKKEQKRFFMENYQEDFLQSLKQIHEDNLSSENAIVAWSYELLTAEQTKRTLQKNKDDFPSVLQALSNPEFYDDRPCEEIMCLLDMEKRKHQKVR